MEILRKMPIKSSWEAVEGCRKDLEEATDKFAQFENYRWRKKF